MFAWIDALPPAGVYLIILILTAIVYQTAFAVRLPVLKTALVYVTLAVGCLLLLLFHYMGFPMIPILAVTVVLIIATRIRLTMTKRTDGKS